MEVQLRPDGAQEVADPRGIQGWVRRWWPEVVVGLLVLLLVGPLVQDLTAQPAPRVAMTGAMVEDRSFLIDDYLLGVDRAERDGHIYSDKAPAQAVLAIPFYVASRALGAEAAIVPRIEENLTHWWLAFTGGIIPLVVLVALMGRAARRRGMVPTGPMLAAMVFGTMLLPFASNLYGHVLTAALLYGAWTLLEGTDRLRGRGWLAGTLMGIAVATEYQAAVVVAVLIGWLAWRRRWGQVARAVVALLPWGALLMGYLTVTMGSPFRTGYESKNAGGESTVTTLSPSPGHAVEILFGSRGLVVFTPIVALALYGLVRRARGGDGGAAVSVVIVVALFLLQASWVNPWGGEMPGPRYMTPALPFLFVGLAEVWHRVSRPVLGICVALSVTSMGLATIADHLVGDGGSLIGYHLRVLAESGPVPSLSTMAFGPWGWAVHVAVAVGAVALLARWARVGWTPSTEGASEAGLR